MQTKRYRVECVDRDTGVKTFHMFDGVDAKAATDLANRMGFLVGESVEVPTDQRRAFPWGVALASLVLGVVLGAGGLFSANQLGVLAPAKLGQTQSEAPDTVDPASNRPSALQQKTEQSSGAAPSQKPGLDELPEVLKRLVSGKVKWSNSIEFASKDERDALRNSIEESTLIREASGRTPASESDRLIAANIDGIVDLLSRMTIVGGELIYFLPSIGDAFNRTVSFAVHKETTCLVISNMTTGMIYNTRTMSSKERAAKVLQEAIIPLLPNFDRQFQSSDVQSFALVHFYGSKDFGSDDVLNTKGEAVCLVVSKRDLRDFLKTTITREELIRRSPVYLSDRENDLAFSRVEITLQ